MKNILLFCFSLCATFAFAQNQLVKKELPKVTVGEKSCNCISPVKDVFEFYHVKEIPAYVFNNNHIKLLALDFDGPIELPDSLNKINIEYLKVTGEINKADEKNLLARFPNTTLSINGFKRLGKKLADSLNRQYAIWKERSAYSSFNPRPSFPREDMLTTGILDVINSSNYYVADSVPPEVFYQSFYPTLKLKYLKAITLDESISKLKINELWVFGKIETDANKLALMLPSTKIFVNNKLITPHIKH